jgi:hypothetical protein
MAAAVLLFLLLLLLLSNRGGAHGTADSTGLKTGQPAGQRRIVTQAGVTLLEPIGQARRHDSGLHASPRGLIIHEELLPLSSFQVGL